MTKVSIVIPTLNHLEDSLKPCLEAVLKYTDLSDKEIIVVPNGCTDGTIEYLQSLGGKVKIVSFDKPMGYIVPTNAGVEASCGEFVVLLSNDCYLMEQPVDTWINALLEAFVDEKAGVAGPLGYTYPGLGFAVHGGCAMYRRKVWDEVGGYDTKFGYGYISDVDISLRITKAGYKAALVFEEGYQGVINGDFIISFPLRVSNTVVTMDRTADALLVGKNRAMTFKRHEGKPSISIVVPTHNRLENLKVCLDHILMYTDFMEKELIVVPNGCTDGTLEYLESLKDCVTIINIPEASGQVVPANVGVEAAKGEFVVLLDDDSILLQQKVDAWIRLLYAPFEHSASSGITGVFIAHYPKFGLAMHNGCVMFRKRVWGELGKFDTSFGFGYLYDVDFSLKVRRKGYDLVDVGTGGTFPIYHPDSPVTTDVKQKQAELITKNYGILLERYS